jgi:hypothetical protein
MQQALAGPVAFSLFINTAPGHWQAARACPACWIDQQPAGSKTDPIEMTVIDRAPAVRSIWHGRIHCGTLAWPCAEVLKC